jgi:hypothetical protein
MRRMSPHNEANRLVPSPRAIFVSGTRSLFRLDFGWMTGPRRLARRSSRLVSLILFGGFELSRRSRRFPEWTGGCARSQPAPGDSVPLQRIPGLDVAGCERLVDLGPRSSVVRRHIPPNRIVASNAKRAGRTSSNPQPCDRVARSGSASEGSRAAALGRTTGIVILRS